MFDAQTTRLINSIISSPTLRDACSEVGITERAVGELMSRTDFRREIARQSDIRYRQALEKLQRGVEVAVTTLIRAADHTTAIDDLPTPQQVSAANLILTHAAKAKEQLGILEKLEELESDRDSEAATVDQRSASEALES